MTDNVTGPLCRLRPTSSDCTGCWHAQTQLRSEKIFKLGARGPRRPQVATYRSFPRHTSARFDHDLISGILEPRNFPPKTPVVQVSSIPTIGTISRQSMGPPVLSTSTSSVWGFAEDDMTLKKPQRPGILGRL